MGDHRRCRTEVIDMLGQEKAELSAFRECVEVARRFDLWSTLAWSDTKLRYRRTKLGPFWITISTGLMVSSVGLVYGQIFGNPTGMGAAGYIAYFAVGIILWAFISATITEGCAVFVQAGGLIKALQVPLLLHVYRMMARNVVLIAHNAVIILLMWAVQQWPVGWGALLALPGLVLVMLSLFGVVMAISIVCTRFRDVQQIIGALLQLMFLLTPIIWPHSTT
jgi:ABC-type polysaccharide/polyol phosphate export permease